MLVASMACGQSMYERLHMMRANRSLAWTPAGLDVGLVSYWAMRTNSATTVWDEYGTNTGTAVNGVVFGSAYGKRDEGVNFDGTNDYVSTQLTPRIIGNITNMSISVWVKQLGQVDTWAAIIASAGYDATNQSYDIRYNSNWTAINSFGVSSTNIPSINQWCLITSVRSETNSSIYINGILSISATKTNSGILQTAIPTLIGADNTASGNALYNYYKGSVDEVAIWGRALTSDEVFQLYSQPLYKPYRSN